MISLANKSVEKLFKVLSKLVNHIEVHNVLKEICSFYIKFGEYTNNNELDFVRNSHSMMSNIISEIIKIENSKIYTY